MATVNESSSSTKVRDCLKTSKRVRGNELSERKVDCIVPGCKEKSKTYRVLAKHFLIKHSTNSVLGIGCNIPSCLWFCMKSLKCFTEHMKLHGVTVGPETEMVLMSSRKYQSGHSAICNTMKSDTIAAKLEELKGAKKIVKNTTKVNKDTPTNNNNQQNPEILNEVEVSDNRLDSIEEMNDGVEALIVAVSVPLAKSVSVTLPDKSPPSVITGSGLFVVFVQSK